jgi:tetratricopeptide (TPR) repeat protein
MSIMPLPRFVILSVCILFACGEVQKKSSPPLRENAATIRDGEVLLERNEFEKAAVLFEKILVAQPDNAEAHYYLGFAKKRLGDSSAAEKHYRLAIECDSGLLPAHNNLGLLLLDKGDLDRAEAELRIYLKKRQDDPAAHFNYGLVLEEMGRIDEAENHYKRATELDPKDPYPWIGLGDLARHRKEFEKALTFYAKAKEWTPELPELLLKEGQTLLDLNRVSAAIAILEPLPSNRDAGPDLLAIAGVLLAKIKKEDQAIRFYQAALSKDDGYAPAHLLLANALARERRFAKAADHFERFLALSEETPQTPEIRKRLAFCKSQMK